MTKKSDDSGGYLALFFVIGIIIIALILWALSPRAGLLWCSWGQDKSPAAIERALRWRRRLLWALSRRAGFLWCSRPQEKSPAAIERASKGGRRLFVALRRRAAFSFWRLPEPRGD